MTARPRASTATHLPLPFPSVIKSLINLQGVAEKSFKYHGTSCMKCLDIFSIIYFSFVENINVALQKNSKLEGKWGSSQQFLFKLRCLALVKFEFGFFFPPWFISVLSHHLEQELVRGQRRKGRVWRKWEGMVRDFPHSSGMT